MKKYILLLMSVGQNYVLAQNVGINTLLPNASAVLDVVSTGAGFAMPRMTTAQRLAIVNAIDGLQVYDTNLKGYYYFNTSTNAWNCVTTPAGTVDFFANATPPIGYLECNGQTVSSTIYPELFTAIGYMYGGSAGLFAIPDLRGEFIRGWDNAKGTDPNRIIGTNQLASAIRRETGTTAGGVAVVGAQNSDLTYTVAGSGGAGGGGASSSSPFTFYSMRPRNVAMLPCIKYLLEVYNE
jgi:hypothetical protein